MRAILFSITVLIVLLFAARLNSKAIENLPDVINSLKTMEIDRNKIVPVDGYFWEKDGAVFNLNAGKIYFMKPIGGKIRAAVFIGEGDFQFMPTEAVERLQLTRFYETEIYSSTFNSLFMIFGDSTYNEITSNIKAQDGSVPEGIDKLISNGVSYITDDDGSVEQSIATLLLEDATNDFFYAQINNLEGKPVFYQFSPYEVEEVSFSRGVWFAGYGDFSEVICQFNKKEDYKLDPVVRKEENKDNYDITDLDIDMKFESNLYNNINVSMKITSQKDNLQWLPMVLLNKMKVNSVETEDGNPLYFYKPEDAWSLFVKLDEPLSKGDSITLKLNYEGELLRRMYDFVIMRSSIVWYPLYGDREKTNFNLKYTVPDNYEFASVGELLEKKENKKEGTIFYHYKTKYPIRNCSFIVGTFYITEIEKDEDLIPITVFYQNTRQLDPVKADLQNSYRFYTKLFGEVPIDNLGVSEIPGGHGEAFPGLTHLSRLAFGWGEEEGKMSSFVSHEMAHQWWGIAVDFKTYRDQWISEAFAQYSSFMYTQTILQDNKKFFRILDDTRKTLVELNEGSSNVRNKPGPISLGRRTNSTSSSDDYNVIIYEKGAWVLHMLRNMFIQVENNKFNEDAFMSLMNEFYQKYTGGYASTEEFQQMVAEKAGTDVSWFFDQWVHGTEIPKYVWGYKVTKTENGLYNVKMRVKTEKVSDDWVMPVPIQLVFEDGTKSAPLRLNLDRNYAEINLGNTAQELDDIEFNAFLSVLCEEKKEDFDDILPNTSMK